jgi:hypothetical protein
VVNFATPNIPGASDLYNKIAAKVAEKDTNVLSKLESTASELKAQLETDLEDLKSKILAMIPELPPTAPINLQAEITSLLQLTPGSDSFNTKLASISQQFSSGLKSSGYELDKVISEGTSAVTNAAANIASGTSSVSPISALSAAVPNLELSPIATEAVEVAKAALQPIKDSLKELASKFEEDMTENELEALYGDGYARETLSDESTSLASKLKSSAEAFGKRVERLGKEFEEAAGQRRQDAEFMDT